MSLAPEEREQLALSAWESLGEGSNAAIIGELDPEGSWLFEFTLKKRV